MGRPTEFSDQVAGEILERIAGGESLRAICEAEHLPTRRTVFRWLADPARAEFCHQYARAREAQAEHWAEEILEIADDSSRDVKTIERKGELVEVVDHDVVQRSKLRVDTRKWLLSKLAPRKYGDKVELGSDPNKPIVTRIERVIVRPRNSDTGEV